MSRYDRWSHDGAPTGADLARIQRGIDATMRDVVRRDARHNPQAVGNPQRVAPAGASQVVDTPTPQGVGSGWAPFRPLESPPGQDAIERIANALAGPVRGQRPKREEKK